jgi:hypothetical protein
MNDFEKRWQECASRARQAEDETESPAPGFAARVWARSQTEETAIPWEALWLRWSLRSLIGVSIILTACLTMEMINPENSHSLIPHVEDTVAEMFWML